MPESLNSNPPPSPIQNEADRERHFNLSLDLLCVAGLDGYFKEVNPSWTRVLGWSRAELLSRPVADFIHPEDREQTLRARADLAKGIPLLALENRYLCKNGSYRWLSWQSSVETENSTVFGVARDITERRQTENEQLILSKLKSTGVLAGGIAHDFNNLLTGFMLNVEMIRFTGDLNSQQKTHLQRALDATHAAHGLTQQLLTFASGGDSVRTSIHLERVLRQSLDLALKGSNSRGDAHIVSDLWPAEVDEEQIAQVVRNLVLNAREAMPAGGTVSLRAENIALDLSHAIELPAGNYLHISVTDEGTGISPEVLPRVFDPYFSTKQRGSQKGMGLGLTICHAVIRKHGGTITIESTPARGTTVHYYLPASDRTTLEVAPHAPLVLPVRDRAYKLLVMDDEAVIRTALAQTLVRFGYVVESAEDGTAAISLFEDALRQECPFDAVLLDLTVKGGMGGAETIRRLRERDPGVKAVLLTGYSQEPTFRDYAQHGFSAALAKPFQIDTLRSLLTHVIMTGSVGS